MFCILQEDIQGVCIRPIDVNFAEHVKLNTITLYKFLDFFLASRFLATELITGKSKNAKTFLSKPGKQIVIC